MVKYECDVCGKEAVSTHRVDRYQIGLELCAAHLPAFVDHALKHLPQVRTQQVDNGLARTLMDALVAGSGHVDPPKDAPENTPPGFDPAKGIKHLHDVVDFFIKVNQPLK